MHFVGSPLRAAGASVSFGVLLLSMSAVARPHSAAGHQVDGYWDTSAGRIRLVSSGKAVTGTLIAPSSHVALARGQKVLDGVFEEGNLSANLRLELVSASCQGDSKEAFAVMLLAHGKKLIGGVSSGEPCAANISALVFQKARNLSSAKTASRTPPGADLYDAHGKRKSAMRAAIRPIMEDGLQYMNEGQFEKARARFEEALKKDPEVGEAYNGVGATYAARNDYENAIAWYKRGLEAAPGFGDLYYNLACAYSQEGKKSIAVRYFRLAVKKGYAEVQAIDADHDLDPLRGDPEFISLRKELDKTGVAHGGGQ